MGDFSHSGVPQGQAGEAFRSLQGLHHGGPQQREVGGLLRPLHQNGIRPEVRPPVDHRHMAADVCQIQRILQGGAAASGHCHILSGVKGSVAHSAEGDAGQTILARKAQGPAPHPGGQDYRPGGIGTVVGDHPAGRAALDLQRLLQFDPGPRASAWLYSRSASSAPDTAGRPGKFSTLGEEAICPPKLSRSSSRTDFPARRA